MPNEIDKVLAEYGPVRGLLPFVMPRPPRMTDADIRIYEGAAYATPFESYIRGDVAAVPPRGADYSGADTPLPDVVSHPGHAHRHAYAQTFADSLASPILAYGLDFSRFAHAPSGVRPVGIAHDTFGLYDPAVDTGVSIDAPNRSPGANMSHEMIHRSIYAMADDADRYGIVPYDDMRDHNLQHDVIFSVDNALRRARTPMSDRRYGYDDAMRRLDALAEQLRRARGDFSRVGPR